MKYRKSVAIAVLATATSILLGQPAAWCADAKQDSKTVVFEKGQKLYNEKKYKEATVELETAMRLNPANSEALYLDAQCYQHLGNRERAKALFQHTMAVFPHTKAATQAEQALHLIEAAEATANALSGAAGGAAAAAPTVTPAGIDDLIKKARELNDHGKHYEAERTYMEAVRDAEKLGSGHTKHLEAVRALADFWTARGKNSLATGLYQQEIRLLERKVGRSSPQVAASMIRQSTAYKNEGDFARAEDMLRKGLDIYKREYESAERNRKANIQTERDNYVGTLDKLAELMRRSGRNQEAMAVEQEAQALRP